MSNTVRIKRGGIDININRKHLVSVDETPFGVVFNFDNKMNLQVLDDDMPRDVKARIRAADAMFPLANLIFNLDNYINPVEIEA